MKSSRNLHAFFVVSLRKNGTIDIGFKKVNEVVISHPYSSLLPTLAGSKAIG
jgi:hypothetical protein